MWNGKNVNLKTNTLQNSSVLKFEGPLSCNEGRKGHFHEFGEKGLNEREHGFVAGLPHEFSPKRVNHEVNDVKGD